MVILRELMFQAPFPPGRAGKLTLSQKPWIAEYPEITAFQKLFFNPSEGRINYVFGTGDALDDHLLSKKVSSLNGTTE
ncbi:hypothetical protein N0V88_006165 [Collariella sp. IMI 366227]|nr:hypothetical protein N0V88_006165 [Collariella sp. IMI 366227]